MKLIQKTSICLGGFCQEFVLKTVTVFLTAVALLLTQSVLFWSKPALASPALVLQHSLEETNTQALASEEYQKSPYLKPGAPVQFQSPSEYSVTVGQSVSLELALGLLADGEAIFTFKADDGLEVVGATTLTVKGKKQAVIPMDVTLTTARLSYLHIFVGFKGALGQETRRTFAVAFDGREPEPARLKTVLPKPFVQLQAEETIY